MKENESKEESESKVKSYIKNCLNVDIEESDFNRIHRIGPKINKNGKAFQQVIVKFKGFVPWTKVYRARKHKADIAIHFIFLFNKFLESVAFLHLLLHKNFSFLSFECPLKLLRKYIKSSLNILLLCLYFSPYGHCWISESMTEKQ